MNNELIRNVFLYAPPFILSLSFHEWAHAWTAFKLGDPTAKMSGRLTVDPMAHISWVGTVILPALAILRIIPFFFGWAKPVPVDARYFKKPRAGMAIVAAAGPASNVLLAIVLAILFGQLEPRYMRGVWGDSALVRSGLEMIQVAIIVNISLAVFNMLPIPPLDGSRILSGILKPHAAHKYEQMTKSDLFVPLLLILVFFGAGAEIIGYPIKVIYGLLSSWFMGG